jgi:hypothetical protein
MISRFADRDTSDSCQLSATAADRRVAGTERNGISKETDLPRRAERRTEAPVASCDIGDGYSTPAVVGERLYPISNVMDNEFVHAISAADGKRSEDTIGEVGPNQGPQFGTRSRRPSMAAWRIASAPMATWSA